MYAYAFLKTPAQSIALPHGMAAPLHLVRRDHLSAVVEFGLELENLQKTDDSLMRSVLVHDRVMRNLFLQVTILPLRFGTCFHSEAGLLEHLSQNQFRYLKQLTYLEGKAEYTLKLSPRDLTPAQFLATEGRGRDYFLAKKNQYQHQLEQQHRQQEELEQVLKTVSETYPEFRLGQTTGSGEKVHLLVERDREDQLRQHLEQWWKQCNLWQLSIEEGLPPYHFVGNSQ